MLLISSLDRRFGMLVAGIVLAFCIAFPCAGWSQERSEQDLRAQASFEASLEAYRELFERPGETRKAEAIEGTKELVKQEGTVYSEDNLKKILEMYNFYYAPKDLPEQFEDAVLYAIEEQWIDVIRVFRWRNDALTRSAGSAIERWLTPTRADIRVSQRALEIGGRAVITATLTNELGKKLSMLSPGEDYQFKAEPDDVASVERTRGRFYLRAMAPGKANVLVVDRNDKQLGKSGTVTVGEGARIDVEPPCPLHVKRRETLIVAITSNKPIKESFPGLHLSVEQPAGNIEIKPTVAEESKWQYEVKGKKAGAARLVVVDGGTQLNSCLIEVLPNPSRRWPMVATALTAALGVGAVVSGVSDNTGAAVALGGATFVGGVASIIMWRGYLKEKRLAREGGGASVSIDWRPDGAGLTFSCGF